MSGTKRLLGVFGESLAVSRLVALGYRVVARNVRLPEGEIDIVAIHRGALVICEVKARRGAGHGQPEEAIGRAKADRLCRLAERYREGRPGLPPDTRIDVVAVELDAHGKVIRVEVIEDAVQAS